MVITYPQLNGRFVHCLCTKNITKEDLYSFYVEEDIIHLMVDEHGYIEYFVVDDTDEVIRVKRGEFFVIDEEGLKVYPRGTHIDGLYYKGVKKIHTNNEDTLIVDC